MANTSQNIGSTAATASLQPQPGFVATKTLNYLKTLEAESIQIFREAAAVSAGVVAVAVIRSAVCAMKVPSTTMTAAKIMMLRITPALDSSDPRYHHVRRQPATDAARRRLSF